MNVMKTTKFFRGFLMILLVGSLSIFSSCDKEDEPTPPAPQPAKYTIKGQVLSQQDNSPLQGVTVIMGNLNTTTNTSGIFEFKDLTQAGKYTLVFSKDDFFDATYSLEFQEAAPNHTITFNISVTMVPYVPGVTPITPVEGGTIDIGGAVPVTLTIPAGTTVTDANNQPVTGSINITAVITPDVVVGTVNNPGIAVLRFEPSGLQFSNPLPLVVDNPLTANRFKNVQLEYFNESTNQWEVQQTPVTYDAATNKYSTSITHFSVYKISYITLRTSLGAMEEDINVVDTPIENTTLSPINVTTIKVDRKKGYIFETPVATVLSNAGITGADATALEAMIKNVVKPYFGNTSALASFETIQENITVSRIIQPNYKLVTTGRQAIDRNNFEIEIETSSGTKTLNFEVHSAGATALFFQDIIIDDHSHGSGGGGTL